MLSALLLLSAAAAVADVQPAAQPTIVVTAQRPAQRAAVRRYVGEVGAPARGQLARFHTPVCPSVDGIPQPHAARIVERIRQVASSAGLRVGRADCDPNATLVFTEDAALFVEEARRRERDIFAGVQPAEIRRMVREDRPAMAWRTLATRNEDGSSLWCSGRDGGGRGLCVPRSSIIMASTRHDIFQSYVVIEQAASIGKSLNQLADYAAMRLLSELRPPRRSDVPGETILTLFDAPEAAPRGLSALDSAYLSALYRAPANASFTQQMGFITAQMIDPPSGSE